MGFYKSFISSNVILFIGRGFIMLDTNLSVQNLSKYYKNNIKANNNISIEFQTHEITALIGHNGAGKTTLLNQIGGLIIPSEGQIHINNIDVIKEHSKVRKLVSTMPQFQVPLKGVSMLQAIESIAMIKGFSSKVSKKKAEEIISSLQLDNWKNIKGEKLSGGLQRLTSFAMTVIDEAPVIILDEPTNDVDPIRRILMWKYLRKLADKGSIIIIVTHNLFEVEKYADRYILLDKGCVKKDINISNRYSQNIKHMLCVYDIDNIDISMFSSDFVTKYDIEQKKLTVSLKEENIYRAITIVLEVLKNGKATSYDLKIENLYDNYEDMINE